MFTNRPSLSVGGLLCRKKHKCRGVHYFAPADAVNQLNRMAAMRPSIKQIWPFIRFFNPSVQEGLEEEARNLVGVGLQCVDSGLQLANHIELCRAVFVASMKRAEELGFGPEHVMEMVERSNELWERGMGADVQVPLLHLAISIVTIPGPEVYSLILWAWQWLIIFISASWQ